MACSPTKSPGAARGPAVRRHGGPTRAATQGVRLTRPAVRAAARRYRSVALGQALRAAGFGQHDVVLNCFGYHLSPAGAMFEEGALSLDAIVIPVGVGNQERLTADVVCVPALDDGGLTWARRFPNHCIRVTPRLK